MDSRLLRYYNRELQHVREMGAEFAREFPKIAGRLGMDGVEVADPYVERLLEGFAFLAARVQLKIDSEFPRFSESLLELVYPHYLSPMPSMAIAQFVPILGDPALAEGYRLPRDSSLLTPLASGEKTACEYRTGHDVTFWPLEVTEAKYFGSAGALATIKIEQLRDVKAGLRLSLRTTAGVAFDQVKLDELVLYLRGTGQTAPRLLEQLLGNSVSVAVRPKGGAQAWVDYHPKSNLRPLGFRPDEALLPNSVRSFEGYRHLQEYFAFPERYLFVALQGLRASLARCRSTELEIVFLFNRRDAELENVVDKENFALNCTPVVNLFPKRADRIHLSQGQRELHVVPDRTRPMDFEIWSIKNVQGFGVGVEPEQEFLPFYECHDRTALGQTAFYTVHREPRRMSARQRQRGSRSSYVGNETFISIVDPNEAPFRSDLRQLGVQVLCTNRDLPLHQSLGKGSTDFTLDIGAPVETIRCLLGPTKPRASAAHGDTTWRLISHLSLNYLSLIDNDRAHGAMALRALLNLYADQNDAATQRQIEGVKSIAARPVNGRLPTSGPITFGRGVEITVTCDDGAFEGIGCFMLGLVLREFFAKYVSINSFTTTVLRSTERGEVMRWSQNLGRVQTL
ncbi:MAG TPA: type VI secretion system baseplate subunit TssF [Gammaproteobacteria bacterium]|nr:type VI secretion system baseplate subunit TssF [Gammaproteobacteria bacterium]